MRGLKPSDILYVPSLIRNLTSISKMNDLGMHVTFEKSGGKLSKGNLVLARITRSGNLFILDVSTSCNSINVIDK